MRFLKIVDESFLFQLQTEGKENGVETDERKDDSIVYADLDKSAMSGMLIKNSFLSQQQYILLYYYKIFLQAIPLFLINLLFSFCWD